MSQDKYIPTVQDPGEDPAQLLGTMHVRGVNLDWIQKVRSKFMREFRNQDEREMFVEKYLKPNYYIPEVRQNKKYEDLQKYV